MTVPASATTATAALLALTGWDGPSLQALLPRLFNVTTLAALPDPLPNLARLKAAFAIVTASRLSATTLIGAATNDPAPNPASTVLSDFQSAVRSRYAETDWLSVVQPINDSLRESQRNALVAYILVQSGPAILATLGIAAAPDRVATPDDLFSYFLLDVEMEPCMQTSRNPPGAVLGPAIHRTLPAQPGAGRQPGRHRRPGHRRAAAIHPVGLAQAIPGLAGQPGGLPVAGELAGPKPARRQVTVLPDHDEPAAAKRHHRRHRSRGLPGLSVEPGGRRQARPLRPVLPAGAAGQPTIWPTSSPGPAAPTASTTTAAWRAAPGPPGMKSNSPSRTTR